MDPKIPNAAENGDAHADKKPGLRPVVKGSRRYFKLKKRYNRWSFKERAIKDAAASRILSLFYRQNDAISVQDDDLRKMTKKKEEGLSYGKNILRSCVGAIKRRLKGKLYNTIFVDKSKPTSKVCHKCGYDAGHLDPSIRVFECKNPECGLVIDRDLNAALNIQKEAFGEKATKLQGIKRRRMIEELQRLIGSDSKKAALLFKDVERET